jgi:hypothetical protein
LPPSGEAIIKQMHDRYAGKWYRTLTFVQKSTFPDGKVETWYEALMVPGKLRIDIAPLDSMHAIIYRSDSMYEIKGGTLAESKAQVHPLMLLGFDVYSQPPGETARKLTALGFDLGKVHEDRFDGRAMYVVGALEGDTTSRQFWIDKERLYFVRSIEPGKKDPTARVEARFGKYVPMGRGWVETEVRFVVNGEEKFKEEYTDPKANVVLDSAIFSPDRWVPPGWVKESS